MGGGAREGCWGVIFSSIIMASTNPCFNRGANGTCVLVSIQGRCCSNTLVRPMTGADHRDLFAGFVVRAVSPKAKGTDTTYSGLFISPLPSAGSSPLSPIQYIPCSPRPGTWAGGWISTLAPMPPDEWHDIACPAGGCTIGILTSSEGPVGFASPKAHGCLGTRPFDSPPDPGCVLDSEPTACWADSTEKGPRSFTYNPLYLMSLYSGAGSHDGKLLLDSWAKSIGPWGVGQVGGPGTTERDPVVAVVQSSGGGLRFSACIAAPGIRAMGKYCAPVTNGPPASCEQWAT